MKASVHFYHSGGNTGVHSGRFQTALHLLTGNYYPFQIRLSDGCTQDGGCLVTGKLFTGYVPYFSAGEWCSNFFGNGSSNINRGYPGNNIICTVVRRNNTL